MGERAKFIGMRRGESYKQRQEQTARISKEDVVFSASFLARQRSWGRVVKGEKLERRDKEVRWALK